MKRDNSQISFVSIFAIVIIVMLLFAGNCFGQIKRADCIEAFGQKDGTFIYNKLMNTISWDIEDLLIGLGYSFISGIGLGMTEAKAFGYKIPSIPDHTWFKKWYNKSSAGDGIFGKSLHFNKVFRTLDYSFDRRATLRFDRYVYYGEAWWKKGLEYLSEYALIFVSKNLTATLTRDIAKYGYLHTFEGWSLDLDYLIYRLFGQY
ncbi:MAG: hypothetical protein ABIJ40_15490 [Bacteroidota bacterium]